MVKDGGGDGERVEIENEGEREEEKGEGEGEEIEKGMHGLEVVVVGCSPLTRPPHVLVCSMEDGRRKCNSHECGLNIQKLLCMELDYRIPHDYI